MAFVPDASIAAAWVLPDEEAALADLALDRLGAETAKAPGVFWHELPQSAAGRRTSGSDR